MNIPTADIVVALLYLAASVGVGLWMGRSNKNMDDYLLGGRDIPWWAILGSIVATETSTVTFLSVPGSSYAAGGNMTFLQLAIGYIVGRFLVVSLLLPAYFRGEILTAYQLLQTRFGVSTRRLASLMFLVARNLGDGLRLFLAAVALKQAVGLPLTMCILITGAVTILYTLFGGLRSVVFSDCVQFVIYMLAGIASLYVLVDRLPGGWSEYLDFGRSQNKFHVLDFTFGLTEKYTYTFWAGLIGGAFLSLGTHGADQMMVQRCLAARSQRDASRAMIASGFVVAFQFLVFLLIGVGLAAFYSHNPVAGEPLKKDVAYAHFIVNQLPTGLVGLTLAGIFAAAMSTLSSSLNSSASTLIGDFGNVLGVDRLSAAQRLTMSRAATFVFGLIQIGVATVAGAYDLSQSVIDDALAIAGFTAGILLGVFVLGQLRWPISERGAIAGMLTAIVLLCAVRFVPRLADETWPALLRERLAWPWYPVVGSLTTVAIGILASLPFPPKVVTQEAPAT
jgi:solute:Na+ symporter, SSS family